MASLTGNKVNQTYKALIKTGNNNSVGTQSVQLTDGLGNPLPIEFSSSGVKFIGNVDLTSATVSGAVGPTGPAGSNGTNGSSGSSGSSGVDGSSGTSGINGTSGSSGVSGSSGTSGTSGATGSSGESGSSGTSGISGSSGSSGESGSSGTSGISGTSGSSGVSGSSGTSGISPNQTLIQTLQLSNDLGTYSITSRNNFGGTASLFLSTGSNPISLQVGHTQSLIKNLDGNFSPLGTTASYLNLYASSGGAQVVLDARSNNNTNYAGLALRSEFSQSFLVHRTSNGISSFRIGDGYELSNMDTLGYTGSDYIMTMNASGKIGRVSKPFVILTDAATISWNYTQGYNAKVNLTGQNRSIQVSGATSGDYGTLFIYQDNITASSITFPSSVNKFASSTYSFSGTGSVDIYTFVMEGNNFYWNFNKNFN